MRAQKWRGPSLSLRFRIAEVAPGIKTRENDVHFVRGADPTPRRNSSMIVEILLLGFGVGVLVGLLGIGGGVVLVPAMVYLLRMDQHMAQGTSLLILLPPVGLGALIAYWKRGQVDLRAGILCALGMLTGGYLGSVIAIPLASRNLKGLFGCFLMLVAILLWRMTRRENGAGLLAAGERAGD